MPSKISICTFVCLTLLVVQNSVAKSLISNCNYAACKESDLDTGDGYFASGSAISSQFLAADGSVVTNSKETSLSSDGIKQTFHELKKEADRFVQTGQGGSNIHAAVPPFGNIQLPKFPLHVPHVASAYDSYSSQSGKDHEFEKKLLFNLSPSTNSQYAQVQTQNSAHVHSNPQITCHVCAPYTGSVGSGYSENAASYNTIVGNVAPISQVHSYQKSDSSSSQKNSSYQTPQIPFTNLKPNTFSTTYLDLNGANRNIYNGNLDYAISILLPRLVTISTLNLISSTESFYDFDNSTEESISSEVEEHTISERVMVKGAGSESHVSYQEQGRGQIKSEERVIGEHAYGAGPIAYPSRVVVAVNEPNVANSHSYEKQQSSSHIQTANQPVVSPVTALSQQAETELSKQHQSNLFLPVRVVQNDLGQHPSSYQSSHSYYSSSSSSSSSSSKSASSSDNASPVVVHQNPIKYSASNGYSSSSSSSGNSYSQNTPLHGVSASIYDHQGRGDLIQSNPNAETLCTVCSPVSVGSPVKKTYGVATSYSSQSSTINGKTTENREAAVEVNDNGKVDAYHVKT